MRRMQSNEGSGEQGTVAAEYAIMAALIGAVVVGAVGLVGLNVRALFEAVPPIWP